jgi:signal transduction histidine kinase
MTLNRDPRITAPSASIKNIATVFFSILIAQGLHIWFFTGGVWEKLKGNTRLQINILIGYTVLTTLIVTTFIGLVRYFGFSRPVQQLRDAAKCIALGDFSVYISPRRKDGKRDAFDVMFEDINTMARELASIETLKTDFIVNVSHEIKTPLSVIQGYAVLLQNTALTEDERQECTTTIIEASQKLSTLVGNILRLNKLENQVITPQREKIALDEHICRSALGFTDLCERKGIAFDAMLDEVTIESDQMLLEIVWNNLISNAVKFTPEGGTIMLKLKNEGGFAVVTVSDTGCGMDTETLKHIFDKFYQEDTSHSGEGNGLGLALVKRALDLCGGSIDVESETGYGSRFMVRLPI